MAGLILDTPSRHVYTGDGTTRVFPIPTYIQGDDWIRIEIDGVYIVDRRSYDIVNNSIIFVVAPPADATIDVLVASSIEAMTQLGSTSAIDVVAENITNVNLVGQDIEAVVNVSNNLDIVSEGFEEVRIVAENIIDVNTVADSIEDVNTVAAIRDAVVYLDNIKDEISLVASNNDNVTTVANIESSVVNVANNGLNIIEVASISADVPIVASVKDEIILVSDNIVDIQNASDNAISAKLDSYIAEAHKMTANSYAVEPENIFVKIYTSNGDGTFTITETTDYSALHWEKRASEVVIDGIINDSIPALDRVYSSSKVQSDLQNIEDNVDIIEGDIQTIEGTIVTIEGAIQTIEGTVQVIEGDIQTIEGRLQTAETDIVDRYTKSEVDVLLADKVDNTIFDASNLSRADKYLANQNIVNMFYTNGDLTKIRYKVDSDIDYETLSYVNGNLTSIEHYISTVLKGTTTLSYGAGNLVSAVFVEA